MLTILLVDDEPDAEALFQQNFRREIRKKQYDFLFAQSGEEALSKFVEPVAPDVLVLLSDINMPGMTGMELLDQVMARVPDLPVIMVTAYGDKNTENDALIRGARSLVSKPVDFGLLKEMLSSIIGETER
ncbi:response regulator [Ruegeria meonggei]|uniref:response regulator n=1 Tax=Ruegeria meonggei TaxID=1446476 RepID=UPI00366F2480